MVTINEIIKSKFMLQHEWEAAQNITLPRLSSFEKKMRGPSQRGARFGAIGQIGLRPPLLLVMI